MDFALSAGLSSESVGTWQDNSGEERRRCYWSVVLLKNLHGFPATSFTLLQDEKTPKPLQSPEPPVGTSSQMTDAALEQPEGVNSADETRDLGIVAYAIQLSEIWQKAMRCAHRRGKPGGALPGWSPQSEYAQAVAQLMEFETRFPYKYRFRPARFADQDSQQLERHRDFWAVWFLVQMLYHSILCLLNHPLIMSLGLRNFKMTLVPEVFLQHTAYLTTTHTEWIIHLLDLSTQKGFKLSDPYLAHFVAIVATICLQQSYSEDLAVRTTKGEYFRKCVSFIRDMRSHWSYIDQLVCIFLHAQRPTPVHQILILTVSQAKKIDKFEQVVSTSFHDSASDSAPDSRVFIDLSLFWDIIESSFASELPQTAESYFGVSLATYYQPSHAAEILRSRLLPEPTRINEDGSSPVVENVRSIPVRPGESTYVRPVTQMPPSDFAPSLDDEVAILAQSYFAQGHDFVGSMDDWWYQGQTAP